MDRDYGGCGGRVCAIGKPSNGSLQLRCNLEAALHSLQTTFPSTLSPPLDLNRSDRNILTPWFLFQSAAAFHTDPASHNGQIRINSFANRFDRVVTLPCSAASPPKLLPGLATRLRALATRQTLFTASFSSRFGEAETAFAESLD